MSQSRNQSSEFLQEEPTGFNSHQGSSTSLDSISNSESESHPPLPISQVGAINRKAQIDGTLIGIPTGLILYFLSSRFNLKGQTRTLTSLIGGSTTAYIYSRFTLHRNLISLEKSIQILEEQKRKSNSKFKPTLNETSDLKSSFETRFEAGVGGLESLEDRYSTTRGDH